MSLVSPLKNPGGKNHEIDIIMCWHCFIKTYYEKPYRKNSYREKSTMWCLVSCDFQEETPPKAYKSLSRHIPTYSTHSEVITRWLVKTNLTTLLELVWKEKDGNNGTIHYLGSYYSSHNRTTSKQHKWSNRSI
jgi:hypothetical protein